MIQLPTVEVGFENVQSNPSLVRASCSTSSRSARLTGITQADNGMVYEAEARVLGPLGATSCSNSTGVLTITPLDDQRSLCLVIAAGTNYDLARGAAADDYSFKGEDPSDYVSVTAAKAAQRSSKSLTRTHIADYRALFPRFSLTLPDPLDSASQETAVVVAAYNIANNSHVDPWLEGLLFDYSRYLFISASRANALPPNLQGKWAHRLENAWGADYHANINLQMNHWGVDQTGLGDLQTALWTYMTKTWVPRGTETASLLYGAPGWVVHDEVNIFGHTGMKTGDEYWANYPISAAWMMQHVADHFDYSRDEDWLRDTGYPLLKGVSNFWLSQLVKDDFFHDGTLVSNPCSSPEHGPVSFAICTCVYVF